MEDFKYSGPAPTKTDFLIREIIIALNSHADEYLHNGPLHTDIALNYKNIIIDVYEHPDGKIEIYAYDVNKPEPISPHQCVRISLEDGKARNLNEEKIDSLLSELDFRDWNIERGTPWHLDDSKLIARIEGHTLKNVLLEKNEFYKIEDNKVPKWAEEAIQTAKMYDYESQKNEVESKILPLEQIIIESIEEHKNDEIRRYTPEKGWHNVEPKISPDKISYALGVVPVEKNQDGDSHKRENTFIIYAYDRDGESGKPGRIVGCYYLDATTPKLYKEGFELQIHNFIETAKTDNGGEFPFKNINDVPEKSIITKDIYKDSSERLESQSEQATENQNDSTPEKQSNNDIEPSDNDDVE